MDPGMFAEVVDILEENYTIRPWPGRLYAFETLVITILSQSTADINTRRAFDRLRDRFEIRPRVLAEASIDDIQECIKPAGLYNLKAPRIKAVAEIIVKEYSGDLSSILDLPLEEARERLLELPGVGDKTADILLNFIGNYEVFPVDTHIKRISKRLGLVAENAGYREIRERLEEAVPGERRRKVHFLLIKFGRETCKAIRPRHEICPVASLCGYYQRELRES